jgi:uncharacterized protein involved in exopolysaccharide biosynthesis
MPDFQQAVDSQQNSDLRLIIHRLDQIDQKLNKQLDDHEIRLRSLEREVAEITARVTLLGILESTFTVVASGIAAIVGRMN